jgi:predicted AlkP superfamily pyrophosphatase or phosphodiesterase
MKSALLLAATACAMGFAPLAQAEPVLLISIDGLRPADVTEAKQRGLQLPNLTRFLRDGSYATGVTGVLPTVTYPSHTTLLTGAAPARHGVVNNTTFDPEQINYGGWYWYSSDIKLPTLWSVASDAGLTVANVHWPVSVGAVGVRWNLPQLWRSGHGDDAKLVTALATPGLVAELEARTGKVYAQGIDESLAGDENRGQFAEALIAAHKPDFATVYLTALDHQQHVSGPDTQEARAVLERIDAIIGKLVAAEQAAHPDAVVAVVSDHGFEAVDHETNFFRAFIDAGLIKIDPMGKVTGWDAMPWPSGGSVAVVLARPGDSALQDRVRKVLDQMKAFPEAGVQTIIETPQITAMGGNPQASFYVDLRPGTMAGGYAGGSVSLTGPSHYKGMHGYFPSNPHLRSTFLIMGKGVPAGRSLGEIDMRAIAPTLATILKVRLPSADLPGLALVPSPAKGK